MRAKRQRLVGWLLLAAGLSACSEPPPASGGASSAVPLGSLRPPSPAGASAPAGSAGSSPTTAPPSAPAVAEPNPLHLPPRRVTLDPGKRVFTFSEPMLQGARLGSTLVLYAATVIGLEGDDLIIEGKGTPSYKVAGAYVIPVPDDARLKPGDAVLTEWNGAMKHAVVIRQVKEKLSVRFTDMDARLGEVLLLPGKPTTATGASKAVRFVKQVEGLAPGNYAAFHDGENWRHVLLVAPAGEGDKKRWFALGFGGAALVADEGDLKAIPVKYSPKVGATVWAEWVGTLRKGTVQAVDDPGLFTVKFERAGRPATVGFGQILPPIEP
jgi:hypothetical protein